MSIVRLIVTWLLVAALPLQGMAATSMLFCGEAGAAGQQHQHAIAAQALDPGDEHASHSHASSATHDADHHHAAASGDDHASAKPGGDSGHACPICASCCNSVGLAPALGVNLTVDAPSADLPQPLARISTLESPRPDKPPRA